MAAADVWAAALQHIVVAGVDVRHLCRPHHQQQVLVLLACFAWVAAVDADVVVAVVVGAVGVVVDAVGAL